MRKRIRVEAPDGRVLHISYDHSDVTISLHWNPFRCRCGEEECFMQRLETALEDGEQKIIDGVYHDARQDNWHIVVNTGASRRFDSWEVAEIARSVFVGKE